MSDATLYPEHEKLQAISDQSQACGEFVDWLASEYSIQLCEVPREYSNTWFPTQRSLMKLLAEFFEIDQDKIEAEKRAMLAGLREANTDD